MKLKNMTSGRGNKVANQFIIYDVTIKIKGVRGQLTGNMFQSYDSNIAFLSGGQVYLDREYWDYSVTTSKYRNQFLGELKSETQAQINNGKYKLVDLNN